jgi:hypothetical protein
MEFQKFVFSMAGNKKVAGDHVREGRKPHWIAALFLEEVKLRRKL